MVSKPLLDYVAQEREAGYSTPEIREALEKAGYPLDEIRAALEPKKSPALVISFVLLLLIAIGVTFYLIAIPLTPTTAPVDAALLQTMLTDAKNTCLT